jgi:hypothetical protein
VRLKIARYTPLGAHEPDRGACAAGAPRDLNRPSSGRGVGHLEALGSALGEVASTTNRPGGHGNEEKNEFPRQICGGLSHMGMCKRPDVT